MPTVSCPKCSAAQKSRDVLLQHLRQSRTCSDDPDRFRCPRCRKGFPAPYALSEHIRRPKACLIQQRRQQVDEMLARSRGEPDASREATEPGEDSQSPACPKCRKTYASKAALLQHLSSSKSCGERKDGYPCARCETPFSLPSELATHLKRPRACDVNRRQRELLGQLKDAPKLRNSPIQLDESSGSCCSKCGKTYASRTILRQHLAISTSCGEREARFVCPRCGAGFPLPSHLAAHMERPAACAQRLKRAELLDILGTTCAKCGKSYASRTVLLQHVGVSKSCGDRAFDFACAECGAAFRLQSQLSAHVRRLNACAMRLKQEEIRRLIEHPQAENVVAEPPLGLETEEKKVAEKKARAPFISETCAKCGKSFNSRGALLKHVSLSNSCGDRKDGFACPRCGAAFSLASELARHLRGTRACHIRLKQKELLSQLKDAPELKSAAIQLDEASSDGSNSCRKCGKTYASKTVLRQHLAVSTSCGEREARFVCPRCGGAFPLPSALARHLARPAACAIRLKRQVLRDTRGVTAEKAAGKSRASVK